ncbi:hypothetical protein EAH88_12360 [Rhodanobacter glycinis]|uniref:Uncharacterized protein n=1 Tax=Rhodanobacter glycinis TaxID=582702 RepID=A0A502C368_9GAMM|nr:hypothetical protein EAH88_12360 [Rhodanobacter glycinis]
MIEQVESPPFDGNDVRLNLAVDWTRAEPADDGRLCKLGYLVIPRRLADARSGILSQSFPRRFHEESRFTDSQILAVLKQAEAGTPVPNTDDTAG